MRHIQVKMGRRAPASRDFKLKARLHSYWSRHFQQNMGSRAKLNMPSFLLVAPFSTDSIFITYDLYLDLRFVLILNYKHVRTAGFSVSDTPPYLCIPFIHFLTHFCIQVIPLITSVFQWYTSLPLYSIDTLPHLCITAIHLLTSVLKWYTSSPLYSSDTPPHLCVPLILLFHSVFQWYISSPL
jgi:hypothetical protein